jgi:hypothetical protein
MAQSSGVYPAEPFNGLQCTYNITGATISKYDDVPGFTCTRSMVIQDIQRGGTLGISGSLSAGGYGATVTVTVSAGNKSNTGTYQVKPGNPMSFNQQVAIAKDANTASITVNMEGHYSMGGGYRGVILQANWSERWGAENKPADPNKFKPQPSIVAIQKDLLKGFYDERRIPPGIVSSGETNNKLWWFNRAKYDDYTCGSYQSKILSWLDGIRMGTNAQQKAWLDKFDYGPIQTNCGPVPGGHQAVVIYPKGTNWRETGTVLDPWPEQKPKQYTIEEWKKIFPHGMNPSRYYTEYPVCGSTGYPDPRKTEINRNESNWVRSLPPSRQQFYTNIKDKEERKKRIKIDYANRDQDSRVMADCPLQVYLIDGQGRISGFPDGTLRTEIPGVSVNTIGLPDGTAWTEIAYPSNPDYTVMFKGNGTGPATIYSGFNMQDDSYRSVYKYSVNVNDKRTFTLNQNRENEPLRMFDNGKRTQAQVNGTAINSFEEETNEVQAGKEEKIFENGNIYGVTNGPTNETQFFIEQKTLVTRIQNYHYFNYGAKPGFIGLVDARGKRYGPWQAIGLPGQGNVQNAYWEIEPNIVLPPGIYTVVDSDPSTWSVNPQSGGRGFTSVWGILY